jgi:hypothetical protein
VYAYLVHHWSQANKKNPEFVKMYPYCNSIKDMVIWFAKAVELFGHSFVTDSYFTSVSLCRELHALGCDAVGSIKFPASGVPQSQLWKKDDKSRTFGDCYAIRSEDGLVGVQQWVGE